MTLCTHNRKCLFGDIVDGKMRLNDAGRVVRDEWIKTAKIRDEIQLDEWAVMPNHFHGILVITCRGDQPVAPTMPTGPKPRSIGAVMAGFKSAVTKRINKLRKTPGARLWQRNYWEHVIRNESELNKIRQYIQHNPAQWELDKLHPSPMYRRPAGRPNEIREQITEYGVEAWMA